MLDVSEIVSYLDVEFDDWDRESLSNCRADYNKYLSWASSCSSIKTMKWSDGQIRLSTDFVTRMKLAVKR